MDEFSVKLKVISERIIARTAKLALILLIPAAFLSAQQSKEATDWAAWKFLLGEWIGEGGGKPGQGLGTFKFYFDLGGKILVRKNHADYPETKDQPASSHDDLMMIYQEPGKPTRAIYFDNEGHVINYNAEFSTNQKALMFTSHATPNLPQFRLTYTKATGDTLTIKFEIAPPGKPGAFSPYIEATARRK